MGIQPFTPQFFKKAQAANPLLAPLTFSTLLCKVRYEDKSNYKYLLGEEEKIPNMRNAINTMRSHCWRFACCAKVFALLILKMLELCW